MEGPFTNGRSRQINLIQASEYAARRPFFTTNAAANSFDANGDIQSVMDQEITYAAGGKVEYFAFNYYFIQTPSFTPDGSPDPYSLFRYAVARYKTSPNKSLMRFALNLQFSACPWYPDTPTYTTSAIEQIVAEMLDPQYMKVLGTRPLLFIHDPDPSGTGFLQIEPAFVAQTWPAVKAAFDALRAAAIAAGLGDPYIVAMQAYSMHALGLQHCVDAINQGVADAITTYVTQVVSGSTWAQLTAGAATARAAVLATGKQMIPFATCGWDARPTGSSFFPRPTNAEWATAMQALVDFTNAHLAQCETRLVYLNNWNELSEGGYLCPTLALESGVQNRLLIAMAGITNPSDAPIASFTRAQVGNTLAMQFTDTSA